jgi:hypothetical protein
MVAATAIFTLVLSLVSGSFSVAEANDDPSKDLPKITICHATDSHQNPYVTPPPDDGAKVVNGHGDHTGPVWFSGITTKWGDIIPPFIYFEKVGNGKDAV